MSIRTRTAVAGLVLSAAGLVTMLSDEFFVGKAMVPTKNDRPTVCFGMTYRPDGSPVKLGDTCTPVEGLKRSLAHIAHDETGLKRCVTGPLSQGEYDVLVDFAYQYGVPTACASYVVLYANAGRYRDSCMAYMLFKRSGGYDCSTMVRDQYGKMQPNRRCWGVWTRSLARRDKCLEAAS